MRDGELEDAKEEREALTAPEYIAGDVDDIEEADDGCAPLSSITRRGSSGDAGLIPTS